MGNILSYVYYMNKDADHFHIFLKKSQRKFLFRIHFCDKKWLATILRVLYKTFWHFAIMLAKFKNIISKLRDTYQIWFWLELTKPEINLPLLLPWRDCIPDRKCSTICKNGANPRKKIRNPGIRSIFEDIVPGVAWNRVSWTLPLLFLLFSCRSLCFALKTFVIEAPGPDNRNRTRFDVVNQAFVGNCSPDNLINIIRECLSAY